MARKRRIGGQLQGQQKSRQQFRRQKFAAGGRTTNRGNAPSEPCGPGLSPCPDGSCVPIGTACPPPPRVPGGRSIIKPTTGG